MLGSPDVAIRRTTCVPYGFCAAFDAEVAASSRRHCVATMSPVADHSSTSSRLLLEVPLRRCSVRSVTSQPDDKRLVFVSLVPPRDRVPPSWFLTTSTACSGPTARALLQLAADPGVHHVSRNRPPSPTLSRRSWPASTLAAFPVMHSPREDRSPFAAPPHSPPAPKSGCSRKGAPPLSFTWLASRLRPPPEGCVIHRGVLPNLARLRGLFPRTGLLPPSAVASDR